MTYVSGWRPEGQEYDEYLHGPKTGVFKSCKVCKGIHETSRWPDNCKTETPWMRSDLPSPMIISDSLPDIMHPITGRPVDSKSKLRADYKRRGVEEVGNEQLPGKREKTDKEIERDIAQDVKRTLETLKSDNVSNGEMQNMLRAPAPSSMGITVV